MDSHHQLYLSTIICLILIHSTVAKLKDGDCEVCIAVLTKFNKELTDAARSQSIGLIEDEFRAFCKKTRGRDERFCYYIGGTDTAATGMLNEISKPLSMHLPPDKICEKIKKKDAQICELKYDKEIDWNTVDLKKFRVKELKKILEDWGETCRGCAEKPDFISKIEELKPKYVHEEL